MTGKLKGKLTGLLMGRPTPCLRRCGIRAPGDRA